MSLVKAQDREQPESTSEIAPGQQRSVLSDLLRTLDFAEGAAALTPATDGERGAAPPQAPKMAPGLLTQLQQLAPVALNKVDEEDGKSGEETVGAAPPAAIQEAEPKKGPEDGDPAAEVEAQAELEGASDVVDAPAEQEQAEAAGGEQHEEEGEEEAAPAPVQLKKKGRAKPKAAPAAAARPKAAPRPGPKAASRAIKASGASAKAQGQAAKAPGAHAITMAQAKVAFAWTKRRNFIKHPFIIRRYQRVFGIPANGVLDFHFVYGVAAYQRRLGLKPNGRFAGGAVRAAHTALVKVFGADKKLLLTKVELKQAKYKNRKAIRTGGLKRGTVKEIQKLIGFVTRPPGAFTDGFLRALTEFQRKYGLSPSGAMSGGTIRKAREVLGEGAWRWPANGPITSPFGMRNHPNGSGMRMHEGVDIGAGSGAPIHAAKGGKVVFSGVMGGYGNVVDLQHKNGFSTRYAHCSTLGVKVGQTVTNGQRIATVGNTGGSFGPHLHFEIRKGGAAKNPLNYVSP